MKHIQIVSYCDGTHEERVRSTIERTLSIDGSKNILLDLCETCDKQVQDLQALMERGTVADEARAAKAKDQPARRRQPASPEDRYDCPLGCGVVYGKTGMKRHLPDEHGMTLGQVATRLGRTLEGKAVTFVCPDKDCRGGFGKPQAYGQHRLQTHHDPTPIDIDGGRVTPEELGAIREELMASA